MTGSPSRTSRWQLVSLEVYLAAIAPGEDVADSDVRRVLDDLVDRAVALLTSFHADISEDSTPPALRVDLLDLSRTATRRWLRGGATRELTHELLASTLEHVLRTFGSRPDPR